MGPKSINKGKGVPGSDKFIYPNGDKYIGEFLAFRNETVFKHGYGKYTTWDGQIYDGRWIMDKLVSSEEEKMILKHSTEDTFEGTLVNQKYHGNNCKFTFNDGSYMICTFQENRPSGEVAYTDPNGHEWVGYFKDDYIKLKPKNHFLTNYPK